MMACQTEKFYSPVLYSINTRKSILQNAFSRLIGPIISTTLRGALAKRSRKVNTLMILIEGTRHNSVVRQSVDAQMSGIFMLHNNQL